MTSSFRVPDDWYKSFFAEPVVRFWDALIPSEATRADVAFIRRHLAVSPPATILDIPCGTGRHSIELARAGFTVVAVDASHAALERARANADCDLPLTFHRSDMLKFSISEPVDSLICMGNSIGYAEPAATQRLLRRFGRMLKAGGRLILDTGICAESLLPLSPERRWEFPGGCYDQEIYYDVFESTINTRARLVIGAETHELKYRHFVMTSGQLVSMLRKSCLEVLELFGDTDDAAFAPGAARLLIVAVEVPDNNMRGSQ